MGFKCRMLTDKPQAREYTHPERPEAVIRLPAFPLRNRMLEYHFVVVRTILDLNGIIDATKFDAKLKKAG
jgi:hypothetical protein